MFSAGIVLAGEDVGNEGEECDAENDDDAEDGCDVFLIGWRVLGDGFEMAAVAWVDVLAVWAGFALGV